MFELFKKKRQVASDVEPVPVDSVDKGNSISQNSDDTALSTLSPKEREVFNLLIEGYKLKDVAEKLGKSYATINTHQNNIYSKLGVSSRAQLIIKYK